MSASHVCSLQEFFRWLSSSSRDATLVAATLVDDVQQLFQAHTLCTATAAASCMLSTLTNVGYGLVPGLCLPEPQAHAGLDGGLCECRHRSSARLEELGQHPSQLLPVRAV